jgi:hypothetical protein
MKKLLSIIAFVAVTGMVSAQTASSTSNPNAAEFEWVSDVYDFGKIPQNVPATARFEFVNTGKEALIITDVQRTCGCTNTEWTKEPIAPGQKGYVTAVYNAAAEGGFTKAITVMSNAQTPTVKLTFKGTVVKDEGESVPVQESIFGN